MLKRFKTAAWTALAARKGRLTSAAAGLLTVGGTSLVATMGFSAGPSTVAIIAGAAGFLASWAVDTAFLTVQGNGVEAIQKELAKLDDSVQPDRWAGPKTLAAVKELVKDAQKS